MDLLQNQEWIQQSWLLSTFYKAQKWILFTRLYTYKILQHFISQIIYIYNYYFYYCKKYAKFYICPSRTQWLFGITVIRFLFPGNSFTLKIYGCKYKNKSSQNGNLSRKKHHFIFKMLILFINTIIIDKILHKIQIKGISVSWLKIKV
jgi:hypothetical protein